jgi:cell pole-organizing protein PopZ
MRQPGEPSVEEILESIKKVIARDNRAAETRRSREDTVVPAPAAPAPVAQQPVEDLHEDDVLDLAASARFLDDVEAEEAEEVSVESLVQDHVRSSMRESLAALAMMAQPAAQPQIVRSGETSLEGLTRELLRPALSAWLDTHLPAMVERLVAEEIARIVGKKL